MKLKIPFQEIETKYLAKDISIKDFKRIAKSLKPNKYIEPSGFDYYYTQNKKMLRHRAGDDRHELTMKEKTTHSNNFVRTELNLLLATGAHDTRDNMVAKVAKLAEMLGFKPNFSIFKKCFIFYYDTFDLVYYIVSDSNYQEQARFIEIEMLEDYPWDSTKQAWNQLLKIENKLSKFLPVISSKNRILKSLYEMFSTSD